jgi:hypothetical protein
VENAPKFQHFAAPARVPKQMCGHDLESSSCALQDDDECMGAAV